MYGREQILKVHMRKVPLSGDVEPSLIARGTRASLVQILRTLFNEAAPICCSRKQTQCIYG